MRTLRLRTELLLATVLLITAVMLATLLLVRQTVKQEVSREVAAGVASSVRAFENVQQQRETQLSRTAAMLSELPTLKALMTTDHAPTIQDGSTPYWQLAGSDLFGLARNDGELLAFHVKDSPWKAEIGNRMMRESIHKADSATWWYSEGRLYWVFLRPMSVGAGSEQRQIGWIAVGYQVDKTVAEQLATVARSQIVLATGDRVIASTNNFDEAVLRDLLNSNASSLGLSREVELSGQRFEAASVTLDTATPAPVRCFVLFPLRQSTDFLIRLNRTLLLLGVAAVLLGALIFSFIARAITHPLENLVAGVRALAAGDYDYNITSSGSSEVAQLGDAFGTMRTRLLDSQRRQIEAERLAALGRTAGSISHDLRHYLAALVANAEFLYEAESLRMDREEVYREIKMAADLMTDLIDSLRELSREQGTISPAPAKIDAVMNRAMDAVHARPEFRSCTVNLQSRGDMEGNFDSRKLERAFFNLLLNACESRTDGRGNIAIEIASSDGFFEVRVRDNGKGIPGAVRDNLFDPFVSAGKPNGTGLGLAIVNKIIHDHNGTVEVEATSPEGTVMKVTIPRAIQVPETFVETPVQQR